MLNAYLVVKWIHVVSSTLLFGTGLGTAFFMLAAYRSNDARAMRITGRTVVLADWIFTTPAVIIQLATGLWLTRTLHISMDSIWFLAVIAMYAIVGLCWLPVVWIQLRIRAMTERELSALTNPGYRSLMRIWILLGVPAFATTLALFAMMVFKPGLS